MNEHYIVTLDRARLRIYAEAHELGRGTPRLEVVEAMDFPGSDGGADSDGDDGQSPLMSGSASSGAHDEALSSVRREQQKKFHTLATELNTFLQNRPAASWDFAAPPAIYDRVVRDLSPETTQRLRHTLSEDLVHQNAEEVREHFAAAVLE